MHKPNNRILIAVATFCLLSTKAQAATYYVDFVNGNDNNNGTSYLSAFKHSPGDLTATGQPATVSLVSGDRIIFRGGVKYKGSINVKTSGVILDGNSDGTFGTGKAIIDGSEPLTGWSTCSLPSVKAALYCTKLPTDVDINAIALYQGLKPTIPAQSPQPSNYYHTDNLGEYFETAASNVSGTSLNDSTNLASFTGGWGSTKVKIWGAGNIIFTKNVLSGTSSSINYDTTNTYKDRPTRYAILNHPAAMSNPGEYYVDQLTRTIYYYPYDGFPKDIDISKRERGIVIQGDNVTVKNFIVEKHVGKPKQYTSGTGIYVGGMSTKSVSGVILEKNEVRNTTAVENKGAIVADNVNGLIIRNNFVHHVLPIRGILINNSRNVISQQNKIDYVGGTGLAYFKSTDGKILNNTITNITGVHSNGISLYIGSNNTIVQGNKVQIEGLSLTTQDSSNITVAFNQFETLGDAYTIAEWGIRNGTTYPTGLKYHNNTILNNYAKGMYINEKSLVGLVCQNNIMDGGLGVIAETSAKVSHNVYTSLFWPQSAKYGWQLREGETKQSKSTVYIDPANRDYRLNVVGSEILSKGITQPGFSNSAFIGPNKIYVSTTAAETSSTSATTTTTTTTTSSTTTNSTINFYDVVDPTTGKLTAP